MENKKESLQTERLILKVYDECDRQQMVDIFFNEDIKKTYMIPDCDDKRQAEELFEKLMDFSRSDNHFENGVNKIDLEDDIEYRGILCHCLYYGIDKMHP